MSVVGGVLADHRRRKKKIIVEVWGHESDCHHP